MVPVTVKLPEMRPEISLKLLPPPASPLRTKVAPLVESELTSPESVSDAFCEIIVVVPE